MSDLGFRISAFVFAIMSVFEMEASSEPNTKSEIRNPKSEINQGVPWEH